MRHRKDHRKLNRATDQRTALLRAQAISLFRHNHIKTTYQKAKESSRFADGLIALAKRGDLAARRQVLRDIHDPKLVAYLFTEIAPRYADRNGGFTRVTHAGVRRGDAAEMGILELSD
jgi:large subunit ribosomal protein L17